MDDIFAKEMAHRDSMNASTKLPTQTYDSLEQEIGKMFSGEHTDTRYKLVQKIKNKKYHIKALRKRLPRLKGKRQEVVRDQIKKALQIIEMCEEKIKALPLPSNFQNTDVKK